MTEPNLDDILDDSRWLKTVQENHRPSGKPLRTSESTQDTMHLDMTTFSVSDYMQGSALYAPDSLAYATANADINNSLAGVFANGTFSTNPLSELTKSVLPLDQVNQVVPGKTPPASPDGTGGASTGANAGTNVPNDLKKYGNGKIPVELLSPVGFGDNKLYGPAAVAFRNMVSDAKAAGVVLGLNPSDTAVSYRSYEQQVVTKQKHGSGAATPGTSNHGWGLAVDMIFENGSQDESTPGYKWAMANGSKYGWAHPDWALPGGSGPHEPWHWEWRGINSDGRVKVL